VSFVDHSVGQQHADGSSECRTHLDESQFVGSFWEPTTSARLIPDADAHRRGDVDRSPPQRNRAHFGTVQEQPKHRSDTPNELRLNQVARVTTGRPRNRVLKSGP
jgi:hypothetical protein